MEYRNHWSKDKKILLNLHTGDSSKSIATSQFKIQTISIQTNAYQYFTLCKNQALLSTKTKQFEFIKDPLKKTHYGFIAQELEEIFPELVEQMNNSDLKGVNYLELVPMLVYQIKEMQKEIDLLKEQQKTNKTNK